MSSMKCGPTHHLACDCREEYFAQIEKENAELKAKVEHTELELEFTKKYLDPADTSFRQMIDSFAELSEDDKEKLINLAESLVALRGEE